MSNNVETFDLVSYLQDSLPMIDDEPKKSEIVNIITTIKQAQQDGYILLEVTRKAHNNVAFENKVVPIYTKKSFAYNTTRYGDAFYWENWILCKPCDKVDSENHPIYVDDRGNHFIIIHTPGSPADFGTAIVCSPRF